MEQVMNSIDLGAILPEIIVSVFALAVLVLQSLRAPGLRSAYGYVTLLGIAVPGSILRAGKPPAQARGKHDAADSGADNQY